MPSSINVLVRRRNGDITEFNINKIETALMNAFIGTEPDLKSSQSVHSRVDAVVSKAVSILQEASLLDSLMDVEFIQDCVERALMASDEHAVLRAYILYREAHQKTRKDETVADADKWTVQVKHGSKTQSLNVAKIKKVIRESCSGLAVDSELVFNNFKSSVYNGITNEEVFSALVLAVRPLIETHPDYAYVAARLHFYSLRKEVIGRSVTADEMLAVYPTHFKNMISVGIKNQRIDPEMATFDLDRLGAALCGERDNLFMYQGAQILTDRYFLHVDGRHIELPQTFFMRVAMGLALKEDDREARAIEFYNVLSTFDLVTSTPTLFNAGTLRPQLSSCFLSTVSDDLVGIYDAIKENALLSKYSGGLGNDWTPVRGLGAQIKGTNGKSQGIIPFLKVVNDTAVAVNQCFAPDTLLYTQNGIRKISSINKGDCVLGRNGVYREVQERMTYEQKDPMLELKVKHSIHSEKVTDAHPLFAIQGVPIGESMHRTLKRINNGKLAPQWVESGQLKVGDYLAQVIPSEVIPVRNFTDDDAYMYGLMLGDGHVSVRNGIKREYGITLNDKTKLKCMNFVKTYLENKGIHYWENTIHESAKTVRWSYGRDIIRNVANGQFESGYDNPCLPFTYDDLYTENADKHVASRFLHLPESQTLSILKGLLETDGHISRGKEIMFSSSSMPLIENVRYLLLRLGIASSGRVRNRNGESHIMTRKDGSKSSINSSVSYELKIPAVNKIASLIGCAEVTKSYAIHLGKWLFSRITEIQAIHHVPFVCDLKVEGDESYMTSSFLAHNGGKRKGAVCAYLETWHIDIEEFLELRKNTGDDRRRAHDMNTANWIPDLFMERVAARGDWTLFSPDEVPDLHDLFGAEFKKRYEHYEKMAEKGALKVAKKLPAIELWRKMLTMLFETGHPWITFKDACNIRSPQQHVGVVHSSNLCTEIALNSTPDTETAVCNLASINLVQHMRKGAALAPSDLKGIFDVEKIQKTLKTGMRMLDNVVDLNYYAIEKARNSNQLHRPVGLGVMGFVDAMTQYRISYNSDMAVEFADVSQEIISYYAIDASADLARERGSYSSFDGSLWSKGILPIDSLEMLEKVRHIDVDRKSVLDWAPLRAKVRNGMRNSNCLAIAPTATIANIIGVSQGIEPIYQNLYVKSNLSGEFTVLNPSMVRDLMALGIWDAAMIMDLKYYDGSLSDIERIPQELKDLYVTAFEMDSMYLIESAARRQKWIDQSQSVNLYFRNPNGKLLDMVYTQAWKKGLKTTYYLRSLGATSAEKSTGKAGALNAVKVSVTPADSTVKACLIDDPTCEACQ